jgi:proteasome lid subunit RPN8/RPN11
MALKMTADVMQELVRGCRARLPQEACAFVVAEKDNPDLGVRVQWMANISLSVVDEYLMDDDAIRLAYGEFDQAGEEVLAVAHSHPTSEPVMSPKDRERAADTTIAYLIVSLAGPKPKVRAYRVERFIGNTIVHDELIDVGQAPQAPQTMPVGPWALLAGNYVRIAYQRTGKVPLSTAVATVIGCDGLDVSLNPDHKTGPRALPLDRIRSVHVMWEGRLAAATRRQLRSYTGEARILLAGSDLVVLPSLIAALARAFPPHIAVTMDEPKP